MKCKTFRTHTLAVVKEVVSIELEFNVWASEKKEINILRTDYFINKRENTNGTPYEELTLFVFYTEKI